jgi:hypothetical protein
VVLLARGPARFDRAEARGKIAGVLCSTRALSVVCLFAFAGCSATDVVARSAGASACRDQDAACEDAGTTSCQASSCGALETQAALCQGRNVHVLAGDSCDELGGAQVSLSLLCACTDLVTNAPLNADSFAGMPAAPQSLRPRLGINRDLSLQGGGTIEADLIVQGHSAIGAEVVAPTPTRGESAPCNCAAGALLDIASLVRAHARDNDNQAAGLSSEQLNGYRGAQQLTLECGRYYFTRLKGDDPIAIRTRGDVAIFVANNIELNDALSIQTETDSQVSVFVAGDMRVGGALALGGDPNGKSRVDLYLASTGTLEIAGSTEISGKLYAPRAELVSFGTFQIYGSLFLRRAAPGGELLIHYDELDASPQRCAALP